MVYTAAPNAGFPDFSSGGGNLQGGRIVDVGGGHTKEGSSVPKLD